jgi:uncharacterized membrane protein HdeD (DUF308 family)
MNEFDHGFVALLSRNWWALALRGLMAIAFGVVTWLLPGLSLAALVLLFGAYTFADGIVGIWTAIAKRHEHGWVLLLWGLVSVAAGLLMLLAPGLAALALLFYIAVWAIATGVLQIVAAIRLRQEIAGEGWFIVGGIASVFFGLLLLVQPGAGALTLLWLIGAYAIMFGVVLEILAFKLRALSHVGVR